MNKSVSCCPPKQNANRKRELRGPSEAPRDPLASRGHKEATAMPDYRLRIGMKFRQQGRAFLIEQYLPDGTLAVKDLWSGETSAKTQSEWVNALFERKLELLGDDNSIANIETYLDKVRVIDLRELADDDPLRMEAIRRYRYVEGVRSK